MIAAIYWPEALVWIAVIAAVLFAFLGWCVMRDIRAICRTIERAVDAWLKSKEN